MYKYQNQYLIGVFEICCGPEFAFMLAIYSHRVLQVQQTKH